MRYSWPKRSEMFNANLARQPKVRYPDRSAYDDEELEEVRREDLMLIRKLRVEENAGLPRLRIALPRQRAINSAASVASVETRGGGVPLNSTFNPAAPVFQPATPDRPLNQATPSPAAALSTHRSSDGDNEVAASAASTIVPTSTEVTVNNPASVANTHMALVVSQKPKSGMLFVDRMGTEIIKIEVSGLDGQPPQTFTVHRNLLVSVGGRLAVEFASGCGDVHELHNVSTIAFKMLIEYAYKGILIKTNPKLHRNDNRIRLTSLCHFYGFAEAYELDHNLLNEVMDGIQDGFFALNSLPPASFCKLMYTHTTPGSPFRKFLAAGVLARHRHPKLLRDENLAALLKSNDEFLHDFLMAVEFMEPGVIPIVREVTAEMEQNGYAGPPMVVVPPSVRGLHPCHFHLHSPIQAPEIQVGESAGENALVNSLHEACYFFSQK